MKDHIERAMSQSTHDLIYDWNEVERRGRLIPKGVTFFDETLRFIVKTRLGTKNIDYAIKVVK